MFRRWAEGRLYRRSMQLAIGELRRAARTPNVLEKLHALDMAEQKLKDAQWLSPQKDQQRFEAGLGEIERSRGQTLKQAIISVNRLVESAGEEAADRAEMLEAAGQLLSFLNHYLPDDSAVELATARLRELGGEQPAYSPVPPLSEMYHRPERGVGCGAAIGLMALLLLCCATAVQVLR